MYEVVIKHDDLSGISIVTAIFMTEEEAEDYAREKNRQNYEEYEYNIRKWGNAYNTDKSYIVRKKEIEQRS